MFKKTFFSIIGCIILLGSSSFASTEDVSAKEWRNGFITAYKAMQVETKLQGLGHKKIDTKKYIIYFNANSEDVSDWDSLMVQMFGYSSSIYKPVRTENNWIIFGSYDNKATAYQELRMLNGKIFKNSDKYHLQIFKNDSKKVFYSDKSLLTNEIKGLAEILKKANAQKLAQKEKELIENQKVAIIYVDKNTGEVIDKQPDLHKKKTTTRSKRKKGRVYKIKATSAKLFSKPQEDKNCFVKNLKQGDRIRIIEKKNGWGKTSKGNFIRLSAFHEQKKKQVESKKAVSKPKKAATKQKQFRANQSKIMAPVEPINGYIETELPEIILYTIKGGFKYGKTRYNKKNFSIESVYKNDYSQNIPFSYKVTDSEGNIYYKVYKKDYFVKKTNGMAFLDK